MIRVYIKEFLNICHYLKEHNCKKKKNCYQVEKSLLERLLKQNNFERPAEKLKIWKALHWLQTDEGHLTKRAYDKNSRKYQRVYALDIAVYHALQQFDSNENIGV